MDQDKNQYQLFPPLSDEEFTALKADIAERGVQVPVVKDEAGNILDGFHRVRACEELGIKDYPILRPLNLSHEQKLEYALNINLLRRHLTPEQRQEIVLKLKQEGWSNRRIADKLTVDPKTVRNDLSGGEYSPPEAVQGKDGKSYPSKRTPTVYSTTQAENKRVQQALQQCLFGWGVGKCSRRHTPRLSEYGVARLLWRPVRAVVLAVRYLDCAIRQQNTRRGRLVDEWRAAGQRVMHATAHE
jgi:ParB-like chromosome segregation protein Spo0J